MSIPVFEQKPPRDFEPTPGRNLQAMLPTQVRGRKYEAISSEELPFFQKYWACYHLRQPLDASIPPVSVCKKMPFFKIEEALKYIEDVRNGFDMDSNDTNPQRGVIYTSAIELAKARFAGKVTFKPLVS